MTPSGHQPSLVIVTRSLRGTGFDYLPPRRGQRRRRAAPSWCKTSVSWLRRAGTRLLGAGPRPAHTCCQFARSDHQRRRSRAGHVSERVRQRVGGRGRPVGGRRPLGLVPLVSLPSRGGGPRLRGRPEQRGAADRARVRAARRPRPGDSTGGEPGHRVGLTRVEFDAPLTEVAPWIRPPMGRREPSGEGFVLVASTSNPAMYAQEWLASVPFALPRGWRARTPCCVREARSAFQCRPGRAGGARLTWPQY